MDDRNIQEGRMTTRPVSRGTVLVSMLAMVASCDSQMPDDNPRRELVREVRELAAVQGFTALPNPSPVRNDLVTLGQALAFDKVLSGNRNIACMTCHLPERGTSDGSSLSIGEGGVGLGEERSHPGGVFIPRNSPAVFNLPQATQVFWDGRIQETSDGSVDTPAKDQLTPEMVRLFEFGALSAQALFPVTSRHEMRGSRETTTSQTSVTTISGACGASSWSGWGTSPSTSICSSGRTRAPGSAT